MRYNLPHKNSLMLCIFLVAYMTDSMKCAKAPVATVLLLHSSQFQKSTYFFQQTMTMESSYGFLQLFSFIDITGWWMFREAKRGTC